MVKVVGAVRQGALAGVSMLVAMPVLAQDAPPSGEPADEVLVTGFRAQNRLAIDAKRSTSGT